MKVRFVLYRSSTHFHVHCTAPAHLNHTEALTSCLPAQAMAASYRSREDIIPVYAKEDAMSTPPSCPFHCWCNYGTVPVRSVFPGIESLSPCGHNCPCSIRSVPQQGPTWAENHSAPKRVITIARSEIRAVHLSGERLIDHRGRSCRVF